MRGLLLCLATFAGPLRCVLAGRRFWGTLSRAMAIRIELSLRIPNSPGTLASICRLLSDERVNVVAMALDAQGQLRMVVDNHVHAAATLRDHHHQVTEREVLVTAIPNSPGALAPALKLISD